MLLHNRVNREELKARMQADKRPYTTISFYRYSPIEIPATFRDFLYQSLKELEVVGRIYVAEEGINAQIALPSIHLIACKELLNQIDFLKDIRLNIAIEESQLSFYKLDIKVRSKIVADGINDPTFNPSDTGYYLEATAWNEMLTDPDTVVIDMRNHYESEVGRFENARCPQSDTFRDELQGVIDEFEQEKDKRILMYCTGGIRCEKASAWMKHNGFNEVYHLKGGIIHYVNQVKETGIENKFHGVNFVFDQRLHERVSDEIISCCHQCGKPADVHTNCANTGCHILFIQCSDCAEKWEGCCSDICCDVIKMPLPEQAAWRKNRPKPAVFSKGRFHTPQ
ncbi:MAG: rhodanese-related sulfurtransferase [Sphingomonadales bacterium]